MTVTPIPEPRIVYPIGTRFETRGRRHPRLSTVVDVLRTYNSKGELVRVRYVATHELAGRLVTDYDVVATTIAKGLLGDQ